MSRFFSSGMTVFAVMLLVGCAAPPTYRTVPVDSETATDLRSFTAKAGLARVYFAGGTQGFGAFTDPQLNGAEFFIDGISVGQINRNEVLALDVVPNTYTFSFQPAMTGEIKREPLTKMLTPGSVSVFRADLRMGRMALLLGPLAASATASLTEISDRRLFDQRTFVVGTGCPSNICPSGTSPSVPSTSSESSPQGKTIFQDAQTQCSQLGFKKGTEKFGDCVMRLLD